MIESLAQFANCNTSLQMRGRHISMDILVGVGDDDFIITLEKGRVIDIQPRRVSLESGIFAIRAGRRFGLNIGSLTQNGIITISSR